MPTIKKITKTTKAIRGTAMRLHGSIAQSIGVQIVSGRLKPGAQLDNEVEASERFQVSRTAYREAVRILSAKGLVHSRPKVGTLVSPRSEWQLLDPAVLSWIFEYEPEAKILSDLFELRQVIEPQAAAMAAQRRTEAHLDSMRRALEGMATHTLATEAGRRADQDFHSALLAASGNAFMGTLTSSIAAAVTWTTIFKQRKSPLPRDPIPDHRRVFDAIAAGDVAGARKAMTVLVDLAFQDIHSVAKATQGSARASRTTRR